MDGFTQMKIKQNIRNEGLPKNTYFICTVHISKDTERVSSIRQPINRSDAPMSAYISAIEYINICYIHMHMMKWKRDGSTNDKLISSGYWQPETGNGKSITYPTQLLYSQMANAIRVLHYRRTYIILHILANAMKRNHNCSTMSALMHFQSAQPERIGGDRYNILQEKCS